MQMQWQAPCPASTPPSSDPPASTVVVTILSVQPKSDMEGDDDFVPFYDNHADIFGRVVIDGEAFALSKIEESDHPHWDTASGRFEKKVAAGSSVPIAVSIYEADPSDDDKVDINPDADKTDLEFTFDLCSLQTSGDIYGGIQQVFEVDGGNGDSDATIRFQIELADGRPVTQKDVALMEVDLVQVIAHADRLASSKPTIVMMRVANNFTTPINTSVALRITGPGGGTIRDDIFPITPALGPGEVRKLYFYRDDPIELPWQSTPYHIMVHARLDPLGVYRADLPMDDCRRANDESPRMRFKVVDTGQGRTLSWVSVGALIDIPEMASAADRHMIRELTTPFINATYPTRYAGSDWPVPVVPPATASTDWLVTVLAGLGIPADNVLPFSLVFELNGIAALTGTDRLMGVLPANWFERFSSDTFDRVAGLSLGEFAPHAVIFPAKAGRDNEPMAPDLKTPAHELGHTYGLSVDSRLKTSWTCQFVLPGVGDLLCGATGGWDEVNNPDPSLRSGNWSSGYWVRQGGEPAAIAPLVDQEQCNSRCLMGGHHIGNRHLTWDEDNKQWIDRADYTRLLDALAPLPDPAVVYVSGVIASGDQAYLGPIYQFPAGIPDKVSANHKGLYAVRLVNAKGDTLLDVGIPVRDGPPDIRQPLPLTFFGFYAPFPDGTRKVQVWNRESGKQLAETVVSSSAPVIALSSPIKSETFPSGVSWKVRWIVSDADGGKPTVSVLLSEDGSHWWPLAYRVAGNEYLVGKGVVPPGRYFLKLVANDESHARETAPVTVTIAK